MSNNSGIKEFVRFEDVSNLTTEDYFNNNDFSVDVFKKKYALNNQSNETYVQSIKRVCDFVASVEKTPELKKYWSERWFDEIYHDWWHPAGSVMQGAGCGKKISLANCQTTSLGNLRDNEEWDSLESIIRNAAYTVAKAAAYRQGVGIDFSRLRPKGAKVKNSANQSTGSIHWMQYIDQLGYYVGQSGRLPALLFSLSCKHPDIEEFISVKSDRTKIQNANISVHCTDDFYEAVKNNSDWKMEFKIPSVKKGEKVYIDSGSADGKSLRDDKGFYYIAQQDRDEELISKTIKARKLLQSIAENMYKNAEPGIQNIDVARKYSNSDYVYNPSDSYDSRIISTNACSEQFLSRESVCILGSINCGRFSIDPSLYEKELSTIATSIVRFLDNVNECEIQYSLYPTPLEKEAIEKLRRIGAGVTDVAGWIFKNNVAYGSKESASIMSKFMERYVFHLYSASIQLGEEKGSFGLFNRKKIEQSPFIKRMMDLGLKMTHLRNVTLSTIAPTGTLSLMFRDMVMGYGIEPSFGLYYWKRTRVGGKYEYYFVVPYVVRARCKELGIDLPMKSDTIKDEWDGVKGREIAAIIEKNKDVIAPNFKYANQISVDDKMDLMTEVSKWIDSSISVTYMLPETATPDDVYKFILKAYKNEIKGFTVFPEKKMYGIVSTIPFKELAVKLISEGESIHPQNFSDEEKKVLNISKEEIVLNTVNAPKREKCLPADIHKITVNKEDFVVVIGLQGGFPYEIFGGKLNGLGLNVKHKHLSGTITKVSRGKYALDIGDIVIEDFSLQFSPVEKLLFRSLSLMLRHGIPIQYIVEQLTKASDDMFSLSAAVARVLKKYIKNGQRVSGKRCQSCQGQLIYMNGCVTCSSCGSSVCE